MTIQIGPGGGITSGSAGTVPDGGDFDTGSGSVLDLETGKYYVTEFSPTQDFPDIHQQLVFLLL